MIDTDKYKIEDDVTWLWKDHSPDEEGWVLWEYKECPAEKGGYALCLDGKNFGKTYKPWFQVLPALNYQCEIDERMQAIVDLPLIIQEVKRLRKIVAQLEDARIESASMFDRPELFDAVREIYEQRLQDVRQEKREE